MDSDCRNVFPKLQPLKWVNTEVQQYYAEVVGEDFKF